LQQKSRQPVSFFRYFPVVPLHRKWGVSMFNYFDFLFVVAALICGYLGSLVGMFVGVYLIALCAVIIVMVKLIFSLEKTQAYAVLFISTIVISIVSVAVFSFITSEIFNRPLISKLNRLVGAVVGIVFVLIICRTVIMPASISMSVPAHVEVVTSYTVNKLVPLIQGILPSVQETIWNGVNNFMASMNPPVVEEKTTVPGNNKNAEKQGKKLSPNVPGNGAAGTGKYSTRREEPTRR
jgi:hypothetical protein